MSDPLPISDLSRLQLDVAARLDAHLPYVAITAVNPLDAGEAVRIQTRIDQQLAGLVEKNGKAGLAALVLVPELSAGDVNLPGPQLRVTVTVRIIENPLVNRGAAGARVLPEEAADLALALLHHWAPRLGMMFVPAEDAALTQVEIKDKIAWDVRVVSAWPRPVRPQMSRPVIEVAEETGMITLTAQAGAAIHYTLDGSYPTAASTLYEAPFSPGIEGPFTLRAIAVQEGYLDSAPRSEALTGSHEGE